MLKRIVVLLVLASFGLVDQLHAHPPTKIPKYKKKHSYTLEFTTGTSIKAYRVQGEDCLRTSLVALLLYGSAESAQLDSVSVVCVRTHRGSKAFRKATLAVLVDERSQTVVIDIPKWRAQGARKVKRNKDTSKNGIPPDMLHPLLINDLPHLPSPSARALLPIDTLLAPPHTAHRFSELALRLEERIAIVTHELTAQPLSAQNAQLANQAGACRENPFRNPSNELVEQENKALSDLASNWNPTLREARLKQYDAACKLLAAKDTVERLTMLRAKFMVEQSNTQKQLAWWRNLLPAAGDSSMKQKQAKLQQELQAKVKQLGKAVDEIDQQLPSANALADSLHGWHREAEYGTKETAELLKHKRDSILNQRTEAVAQMCETLKPRGLMHWPKRWFKRWLRRPKHYMLKSLALYQRYDLEHSGCGMPKAYIVEPQYTNSTWMLPKATSWEAQRALSPIGLCFHALFYWNQYHYFEGNDANEKQARQDKALLYANVLDTMLQPRSVGHIIDRFRWLLTQNTSWEEAARQLTKVIRNEVHCDRLTDSIRMNCSKGLWYNVLAQRKRQLEVCCPTSQLMRDTETLQAVIDSTYKDIRYQADDLMRKKQFPCARKLYLNAIQLRGAVDDLAYQAGRCHQGAVAHARITSLSPRLQYVRDTIAKLSDSLLRTGAFADSLFYHMSEPPHIASNDSAGEVTISFTAQTETMTTQQPNHTAARLGYALAQYKLGAAPTLRYINRLVAQIHGHLQTEIEFPASKIAICGYADGHPYAPPLRYAEADFDSRLGRETLRVTNRQDSTAMYRFSKLLAQDRARGNVNTSLAGLRALVPKYALQAEFPTLNDSCFTLHGRATAQKGAEHRGFDCSIKLKLRPPQVPEERALECTNYNLSLSCHLVNGHQRCSGVQAANQRSKCYALIIAIDDYPEQGPFDTLHHTVQHARDLYNVLTNQYTFEPARVDTLYNAQATLYNIRERLAYYNSILTSDDNLLVYFTGHGGQDSTGGCWAPYDVWTDPTTGTWGGTLPNSELHNFMRSCKARDMLWVVDACHAGTLCTRNLSIPMPAAQENKLAIGNDVSSRYGLTCGGADMECPDEQKNFSHAFIQALKAPNSGCIGAEQISHHVINRLRSLSLPHPLYKLIMNTEPKRHNSDLGEFVFIRKTT